MVFPYSFPLRAFHDLTSTAQTVQKRDEPNGSAASNETSNDNGGHCAN